MPITEKKHLITEYLCFEARNTSVKPANQKYEKGFKHYTHFYVFKTLHTHSTSYGNGIEGLHGSRDVM